MTDWAAVRKKFLLDPDEINLAGMGITAHPEDVRDAIEKIRKCFDRNPWSFFIDNFADQEDLQREAVSKYFDVAPSNVALTDGTTQGLALLYGGLRIDPGGEILTGDREFSYVYEILEARRSRHGTIPRRVSLFRNPRSATKKEILDNIGNAICSHTRVLALTWVYSNTGVKLPIAEIAALVATVNASRSASEKILLCVDGVHGFGIECDTFEDLDCDFFVAGCHKNAFGPRGTGIWCGKEAAWGQCDRIHPTSSLSTAGPGAVMAPGGVHSYEHRWALKACLDFLGGIGKKQIRDRIRHLSRLLKDGLGDVDGVSRVTPDADDLSAGIVCVDIEGKDPFDFVDALRSKHRVIATVSSIDASAPGVRHVRFSVEIFNSDEEIKKTLRAVADLAHC